MTSRWLSKQLLFLTLITHLLTFSLVADNGVVIVLYGVQCSGKSSLAKKLANTLPGNFEIIKRTSLAFKYREEYVHKLTGIHPKNHEELTKMEGMLPAQFKIDFSGHFKKIALDPTVEEIRIRYNSGKNSIFDVCLYSSCQLDKLKGLNPIYVLVYCPIRELLKRTQERGLKRNWDDITLRTTRMNILNGFCKIYRPVSNSPGIDILTKQDLLHFNNLFEKKIDEDDFPYFFKNAFHQFHFDEKTWTEIAPKREPDILIDSNRLTIDESVEIIQKHLHKEKN